MQTNYCGRSCEECEHSASLQCPGCLNGPGNAKADICELASCCTVKGNKSCDECYLKDGCDKLKSHATTPNYIRTKLYNEIVRKESIKTLTSFTGKWQMMFFMAIAAVITNLLYTFGVLISPTFTLVAGVLNTACAIIYGLMVFTMGSANDDYKVAGLCLLGAAFVSLIVVLLPSYLSALSLLLSIGVTILSIYATYKEYNAHSDMLVGISDDLSSSWRTLWKWYIIVYIADLIIGSIFVIITLMALLTVGILRFVNLYKTTVLLEQLEQ